MNRPDKLSTGTIVKLALATVGFMGVALALVLIKVNELQPSDRATAWWWFGGPAVAVLAAVMAYQIRKWRRGTLFPETAEKRAKYDQQMRRLRSSLFVLVGAMPLVTVIVAPMPMFYVVVGGVSAGFLVNVWLMLVFRSTKKGREMVADQRREPPAE